MLIYHFDLKRAMWRMPSFLEYARTLKDQGYTHALLEVEDKFRFRNYPDIAHADAFDHAAWRELVGEFRAIGLEPIPLWQTLGHAEAVLGKPAYAHLREQESVHNEYDPGAADVYKLLFELIDEQIEVMRPGEFFHLGGDETRNLGSSPRLRPLVGEIGVGGLYLKHMRPLFEHVLSRGLRPIIWADIVLAHPEIISGMPRETVMMDWDYRTVAERPAEYRLWGPGRCAYAQFDDLPPGPIRDLVAQYGIDSHAGAFKGLFYADALRDFGFDVITASANRCSGDAIGTPRNEVHLPNVVLSARKGRALQGNAVTSWAIRHNHPATHWPANALAAMAFKRPEREYDQGAWLEEFCELHFGTRFPGFPDALESACLTWYGAQASAFKKRFQALAEGADPFAPDIHELSGWTRDREKARARSCELRERYVAARAVFAEMLSRAKRHADDMAFWLEGIDYNLFHVSALLAHLDGMPADSVEDLRLRLEGLRANTRRLFAGTYADAGVEAELKARYGFFETWLKG